MTAVITLTDEDGNDIDADIIAAIEIEEMNSEYVAVLPEQASSDLEEGEALILRYSEDANGEASFSPIEDEEEFDIVSSAFNQFFENASDEEEEDSLEITDDNYLDDIGDILPGVSINKK